METDLNIVKRCISFLLKQFDYKKMELNERTLKELVSTIRKFDGIMPAFMDVLFGHLRRDDCDLRIGILLIANHFFQRSHYFRLELINSMQDFLIYTLEIDPLHFPLPNPADAAELLKKETMKMLRLWIEKFGPGYPKLQRMANFLKNSKSFDWENSEVNLQIDREREELDRFQRELRARKIVEKLSKIFDDSKSEIERIQIEANSVLELLIPRFCSMETTKNDANANGGNDDEAKPLFAFGESTNGISICLNPNEIGQIERTEENCDLINQLKDTTKQLEHWHTKLGKWIGKLTEIGDSSSLMRKLIDIRRFLNEELQKCREIKIFLSQNDEKESSDDSENDDEFLDVEEKEGYEPGFSAGIDEQKSTSSIAPIICCNEPGPSGIQNVVVNSFEKNNEEKIDNKCPPKLAMGLDLKYWGENGIKPAQRVQNQGEEHWWRQMENNDTLTESMETYNCRQITFISQKPPEIERICRAPLPSGKLCPRSQIHRCTLHGPIIERDEQGFPIKEQKQIENEKGGINEQQKRRDEEEYLRDIEAVTGVKLGGPEKRVAKNGRTARIREKSENLKTRERLKTKLFDKRTLKRVTTTLEHMQKARAERNFSHQFNYTLSNKK